MTAAGGVRAADGGAVRAGAPPSLAALLFERVVETPDRPAIVSLADDGGDPGRWSWAEVVAAAVDLARRLEEAGIGRGRRLLHVGTHGPDWIVVDWACLLAGVVHVALHADASRGEILPLARWLGYDGLVTTGAKGPLGPGDMASLVAGIDDPRRTIDIARWREGNASRAAPDRAGLHADSWRPLAADPGALRREVAARAEAADPDAPATILLSSGTTGTPRGYVHSQRALAANAAAAAAVFLDDPDDVRLSWLPASHSLARTGDLYTALVRGGCLNVVRDRRRVLDACRFAPPTVILGVPAFFERIAHAAENGSIADLRAALGGRVRVCVSGGAALRRRTHDAFAARGVPLVEGYGLAEAGPVVALSSPRDARPGFAGRPLPGVDVRIDEAGQLLVRTPSRAIDVLVPPGDPPAGRRGDGWIATGDMAEADGDGRLRITGRRDDVLALASGVKIAAAEVERALAEDPVVAQVCVCGEGLPFPVALVVPEPAELRRALGRLGVRPLSRRGALRHPRVLRWLARRLGARQAGLPRGWQVRRAILVGRAFAAERGEITHSMKPRRHVIADRFSKSLGAAAASPVPPGVAEVPGGTAPATPAPPRGEGGIAAALWSAPAGGNGGFAAAAEAASAPLPHAVAGVVAEAVRTIEALRSAGLLYAVPEGPAAPAAPLDDAPAPPRGRFTPEAERALGAVGWWGIHAPNVHGGAGGSVLDLVRAVTEMAGIAPTAAGMLAVHSSIGAVSALAAFGDAGQRSRWLPALAAGDPLSVFGATEPDAGCDLGAVRTTLSRRDGRMVVDGTKMFITNAAHGRLAKLLVKDGDRPALVLARLPDRDTASFRLLSYSLHALRHTSNHALEFRGFEVDDRDVLVAPGGDAMAIVWHGLDRGRSTLAAQAAGTLRLLAAHAAAFAHRRVTWGRPIADRELVQGRLARIAAGRLACEALSTWAAATLDSGASGGDLEAITAKIVAGAAVREAAIDALGVHGGRAFLVGHPLGDAFLDHFAVGVYEGESDLLGLALFKGLSRRHPLAARLREGRAARTAAGWLAWRVSRLAASPRDGAILDRVLRDHARAARRALGRTARAIDRAIRRHGRGLAERHLEVAALSHAVRDAASVLAVAHLADVRGDGFTLAAADCWCRMALSRVAGRRLAVADHEALAALGRAVAERAAAGG